MQSTLKRGLVIAVGLTLAFGLAACAAEPAPSDTEGDANAAEAADPLDIAQISAFTYYQARNAGAEIEPIGAQITKEGAEPGYFSVAVKNPASDATSLADFADQKVCFVNPTSTSGFAVPMGGLLEAGVIVSVDNRLFGEEHDLNAREVAEGTDCQVGFAQDIDADPLTNAGVELNEFLNDGWFGFGAVDDGYYDLIRTLCREIADEVEACRA